MTEPVMRPRAYFTSPQFAWSAVIFLIGVGLATLAALVAWLGDEITGKACIVAAISAVIVGMTRLAEGISDASRAATGDVKPRDVQPLPLVPPPPMN
jgi:MFS superfamily sulfate permease-like transporter